MFFQNQIKTWDFLGSTKYNVEASTEEEKQRLDEWHKYLTEDDEEEKN